jgi:hypothetical protein
MSQNFYGNYIYTTSYNVPQQRGTTNTINTYNSNPQGAYYPNTNTNLKSTSNIDGISKYLFQSKQR